MRHHFLWAAGLAVLTFTAPATAQGDNAATLAQLDASLPGTLINDPTSLDWDTQGDNLRVTDITGAEIPGGNAASRFAIRSAGPNPWSVQVYVPLTADIAQGDVVTYGFWARAAKPAPGKETGEIRARIQSNVNPWPGFGDTPFEVGPEWNWYEASATANIDVSSRIGFLVFQIGGVRQEVEIGQTIVVKGAGRIMGDAPRRTLELPPQIAGQGELINQPDNREWTFFGPETTRAQREDSTIYLGSAVRFTAAEKGANAYDIHANVPLTQDIKAGDRLLLAVAAKTVTATTDDGRAQIGIRVQKNEAPYDGFADNSFKVGPNWQLVRINTTATMDIPAEGGLVVLHMAGAAQEVDVGPVYVLKLPPAE